MCKIMVNIIITRLKRWYESQLLDQQQGFRTGRGTIDAIYTLKRVQQITEKMKRPTYVLFIDLTAAFDHIDRDIMFETIYQRISSYEDRKLIQLLESLYSYTTTALAETPKDEFTIKNGVRQGGPESPVLFNLYIDFIMRIYINACQCQGIKFLRLHYRIPTSATNTRSSVGKQTIDWVGYADDLALAFEDCENLRSGLKLLHKTLKRYSLEINVKKTKTMILNYQHSSEEYPNTIAYIDGKPIENVKIFVYLGCIIKYNEPSTGDEELQTRIDTSNCKFYESGKNLMNYKIALETRVNVFNSLVRSRLTHACKTWSLTQRQQNHMNATYVSMLRKMVRGGYRRKQGTYHFVLTNQDILSRCKTENLHAFIGRIQRNYMAHVVRMEDTRIVKRVLFNDDDRKKRGTMITTYGTVIKNENTTPESFNKNALARKF